MCTYLLNYIAIFGATPSLVANVTAYFDKLLLSIKVALSFAWMGNSYAKEKLAWFAISLLKLLIVFGRFIFVIKIIE